MAGHHPFARLTEELPAGSRARIEARKAELRAEMLLHELGQARAMTRKAVGEALDLDEPAVARLERRTDMYVSGLRSCIEAMGGRLDIVARFPQGRVIVTSLSDPGEDRIETALVPEAVAS
ncbi:MAG: XRE family transcriptional regulator [Boseongicola sp.]|nr:XRE family transcriptional regulator [Boseongicola sp.]